MNIEAMWRVPQKRLANLSNVVSRLIKSDMPWYDGGLTPRKLLFGLYVHYKNTCKRVRDLERAIEYQRLRTLALEAQIKDLKEYEKQVVFEGYHAVITCFRWSCGDGCCSDSWHGYQVFNKTNVCEYEYGMETSNTYTSEQHCRKLIAEKFGPIPISEDTQDV